MQAYPRSIPVRPLARNGRKLPIPLESSMRIAQISHPGILFDGSMFLPLNRMRELEDYQPQILIGSSEDLQELVSELERGAVCLSDLDRAVFVLTDHRSTPLDDEQRGRLWNSLAVPVYELAVGEAGSLLASECEAHEGWHLEPEVRFSLINDQLWYTQSGNKLRATGLTGTMLEQPCACGRSGERILHAALDLRDPVRGRLAKIA